MGGRERMITTVIIWIVLAIMMTSASGPANGPDSTAIAGIMGGVALISTLAIWLSPAGRASGEERHAKKSKRRSGTRMARLLDEMDDDDLAELRSRLMMLDDEDDQITLETLLNEQEARRR